MQSGVRNNMIVVTSDLNFPNQGRISLYLGPTPTLGVCHTQMLSQVGLGLPFGGAKRVLKDNVSYEQVQSVAPKGQITYLVM